MQSFDRRSLLRRAAVVVVAGIGVHTWPTVPMWAATPPAVTLLPLNKLVSWGDSTSQQWPSYAADTVGVPWEGHAMGGATMEQIQEAFNAYDFAADPTAVHVVQGGHVNLNRKINRPETIAPIQAQMATRCPVGYFVSTGLTNDATTGASSPDFPIVFDLAVATSVCAQIRDGVTAAGQLFFDLRSTMVYPDGPRYIVNTLHEEVSGPDRVLIQDNVIAQRLRVLAEVGNPGHYNADGKRCAGGIFGRYLSTRWARVGASSMAT